VVAGIGSAGAATFALPVEGGSTVTYQWQTDIGKMWDGTEQRRSLLAKPRQAFSFKSILSDAQQREVLATLAGNAAEAPVFLLGIAYEALEVASSTSTTITVHAPVDGGVLQYVDWDEPGQRVVVRHPVTGALGQAVIQSSAGAVITIDANLTAFAVPGALIMPAQGVYLDADQEGGRYQTKFGEWTLTAQADRFRYGSAGSVGRGATVATHDSLPVWDWGITATGVVSQGMRSGVDRVDLGAKISAMQAYARANWTRSLGMHSSKRRDWQWCKKFLDTVVGGRRAFLLPTGRPDLVPIGDASSGTLVIDSSTVDYLADWYPSLAHRRIKIVKTDGTSAYRTITAAVDNLDGTQDLTLASSLAGAIDHIEFLETARLGGDSVTVTWEDRIFTAPMSAVVVQQFDADATPTTYDEYETSVSSAAPVEIYTIVTPTETYRFTSAPEDVTVSAQLYTAIAISRGPTDGVPLGQVRELEITMPVDHELSHLLIGNGIPPRDVLVTVERYHGASAIRRIHRGYVAQCETGEQFAHLRIPNQTDREFSVRLPIAIAQPTCNHRIYSVGCVGPDTEDQPASRDYLTYATQGWMVACAVVSQTGTTLVVDNMDDDTATPHPDQWAQFGEVRRISDDERRSILSHIGTTLVLDVPFSTIAAADDLEVYAGCDQTLMGGAGCYPKFNNAVNFGGFDEFPSVNPINGLDNGESE
jgi:hypothetical protein